MAERVSVKRAAEILGVSALTIQQGIKNHELPIGHIIGRGKERNHYHISPYLLSQYTGLSVEQIKGGDKDNEEVQHD